MPIPNPQQKIRKCAALLRKADLFDSRFEIARQVIGKAKGLRQMEDYEIDMMYTYVYRYANGVGAASLSHSQSNETSYKRISKQEYYAGNAQRKKIMSLAHSMRWEMKDGRVNIDKINEWCIKYGQYHKPLNYHTVDELAHLVSQFEKLYNSFLQQMRAKNSKNKKEA